MAMSKFRQVDPLPKTAVDLRTAMMLRIQLRSKCSLAFCRNTFTAG